MKALALLLSLLLATPLAQAKMGWPTKVIVSLFPKSTMKSIIRARNISALQALANNKDLPIDLNMQDIKGESPLFWVARTGDELGLLGLMERTSLPMGDVIERYNNDRFRFDASLMLLRGGADPKLVNKDGKKASDIAAERGDGKTARFLREAEERDMEGF